MEGAEIAFEQGVAAALDANVTGALVDDQLRERGAADGSGAREGEGTGHFMRGLLETQGVEERANARHRDPHDEADESAGEDEFGQGEATAHEKAPDGVPSGCVDSAARTSSHSREWKPFMPRSRPPIGLLLVACLALVVAAACYQDPNTQLDKMQETIDLTATIEELGSRTSELQFAVDSLRGVVARQDTVLSRLANLAGVPYAR